MHLWLRWFGDPNAGKFSQCETSGLGIQTPGSHLGPFFKCFMVLLKYLVPPSRDMGGRGRRGGGFRRGHTCDPQGFPNTAPFLPEACQMQLSSEAPMCRHPNLPTSRDHIWETPGGRFHTHEEGSEDVVGFADCRRQFLEMALGH